MTEIAERFRRVAEGLTRTIAAVPEEAWERPSPCEGWDGRDVVRHLVVWLPGPGFLLGTFDVETRPIPSVDDDPAGAWAAVRDAIQEGLDNPAIAQRVEDCGPPGRLSFEAAVEMTCTPDVLIHTWDLARAAGIDVELDPDEITRQAAGIDAMPSGVDEAMRASGHFGPRVEVPADADARTRVLAFYGRRAIA
jgi:uncharacterized protein (TIGR03086 family)